MELVKNVNLIFARNQRLTTERLILRPVTLADVEDMYAYGKDEETTKFVFPTHQNKEETAISIANYFMAAPFGKYGIELKETQQMVGTIDLRVDEGSNSGELGYTLNRDYWGRGIVPEAARELMRFGFDELGLTRIYATHDEDNPNSGRVMQKIGLTKEGRIPAARKLRGKIVTDIQYGVTKEEWLKQSASR
ncbi:acetyltransferase [Enterococcus sp. JM4C]|uniref:GNAT family N-acetyltransferase n=1 Tax=Candidatus Enterococcus huntleyi TaxID=1857217 RepID=UPI00137983FF|nr:GNAT family N-acetyltransferase [Enterococcus sp. JM4C]KAF1297899.1 acetyltransferase [Enterococcus sp. JM4C]